MKTADVVIVGAGHGGAQCAIALRQNGFTGTIAMIGREPEPPYERPPLSKEYFAREKTFDRLYIRPPQFWEEKEHRPGAHDRGDRGRSGDQAADALRTDRQLGYGTLVWAAGGDPRRLACAGADLAGVHAVRTRADCDQLMGEIDGGVRNIVVIGGGYIGLEAAAVLTKLGCKVTLLEALPRVLARVAGRGAFRLLREAEHRDHGVDLRTGVAVDCLEGEGRGHRASSLADGSVIPAEAVIVGIGIVPAVGPLIAGRRGRRQRRRRRRILPHLAARRLRDRRLRRLRLRLCRRHGDARRIGAERQRPWRTCVAKAICGDAAALPRLPVVLVEPVRPAAADRRPLGRLRPDRAPRRSRRARFSVVYLKDGRVIALDCVNVVKDYVQGRKLVEARVSPIATAGRCERAAEGTAVRQRLARGPSTGSG